MIPKSFIDEYLNRPLDSHLWMKQLSIAELRDMVAKLKPKPDLYRGMFRHQLVCFLLGVRYPKFCYWVDMGAGKTLITLELLRYAWQRNKWARALIFVVSDKAFPTWEKQIKRFGIDLPYVMLEGSSEEKWRQLDEFGDGLIFISYPGAVAMLSHAVRNKRGKTKWVPNPEALERFGYDIHAVVLDESTKVSNHQSLTFKLVEKLREGSSIRYALAGRPFGRDPMLLWAQHYLIDDGKTLGPTLGLFREAFFTAKRNFFAKSRFSFNYKFKEKLKPELSRMIQHRSITYSAAECVDLPKRWPIIERVAFTGEAADYYERAVKSLIAAKGNMRAVQNIFLRMRQLSSGFVGFTDDESGERAEVEFEENPKFDRLMELLAEMPEDRKGVIFYDFTYSGRKIAKAISRELGKCIWLWSGTPDYKRELHNFEQNPNYGWAVVQNRLGAFSLDGLQVANYSFFYESPVSVIDREQAERRIFRTGQTRTVFQYDLVVDGSADAKILQFHRTGDDLQKALLRNPSILMERYDDER